MTTGKTRSGPAELAGALSEGARLIAGLVRRFSVSLTTQGLWQLAGHLLLDGTTETRDAEAFTGIGFYARPPSSGGQPEAIAMFVGGAQAKPAIVAARDEATRQAIAQLQPDESAVFTSKAIIVIKADGTVEIRSKAGTARALATKADLDALTAYVRAQFQPGAGHTHICPAGTSTTIATVTPPVSYPPGIAPTPADAPAAVGTTKLKAE